MTTKNKQKDTIQDETDNVVTDETTNDTTLVASQQETESLTTDGNVDDKKEKLSPVVSTYQGQEMIPATQEIQDTPEIQQADGAASVDSEDGNKPTLNIVEKMTALEALTKIVTYSKKTNKRIVLLKSDKSFTEDEKLFLNEINFLNAKAFNEENQLGILLEEKRNLIDGLFSKNKTHQFNGHEDAKHEIHPETARELSVLMTKIQDIRVEMNKTSRILGSAEEKENAKSNLETAMNDLKTSLNLYDDAELRKIVAMGNEKHIRMVDFFDANNNTLQYLVASIQKTIEADSSDEKPLTISNRFSNVFSFFLKYAPFIENIVHKQMAATAEDTSQGEKSWLGHIFNYSQNRVMPCSKKNAEKMNKKYIFAVNNNAINDDNNNIVSEVQNDRREYNSWLWFGSLSVFIMITLWGAYKWLKHNNMRNKTALTI